MKYRPDIDGLRAIAVLSVVVYHADATWLPGGFVGVDTFFVISGFLISTLIAEELTAGTFRLNNFWMRRIRRILPAVYVVMASAAVLFAFVYPPDMYASFAKSLFAQSLFAGNFFFWQSAGYFEPAAELQPLLHTWSLAVEEQFYFFFPIVLWLGHRFLPKLLFAIVALIVVGSLGLSVLGTMFKPEAAFYLIITRAWELGIGALLALYMLKRPNNADNFPLAQKVGLIVGYLLLAYSIILFNDQTPFPSFYALAPCLGAALLIWAGPRLHAKIPSLRAHKITVSIGLISYSLYLWHWVALTFTRALFVESPPLWAIGLAILASFVLATLSYWFVEQPIRRNKSLFTNPRTLAGAIVGFLILIGTSAFITVTNGVPNRAPNAATLYAQARSVDRACENRDIAQDGFCQFSNNPASADIDYFFWGDSHMLTTQTLVESFSKNNKLNTQFASYNHCTPGLNLWRNDLAPDHNEACRQQASFIVAHLAATKIKNVVLIARFNFALNPPEPFEGNIAPYYGDTIDQSIENYGKGFSALITELTTQNINVHVLRQVPNYNVDIPLAAYKMRNQATINLQRPRAEMDARWAPFDRIASSTDVKIIDVTDVFCSADACSAFTQGAALYRDDHHVNIDGSADMLQSFTDQLLAQ